MKSLILGMLIAYSGLVYAGKVEAPELPKSLKAITKQPARSPSAIVNGPSTMQITGNLQLGGAYLIKMQDSANGVVCYSLLSQSQELSSLQCMGAKAP